MLLEQWAGVWTPGLLQDFLRAQQAQEYPEEAVNEAVQDTVAAQVLSLRPFAHVPRSSCYRQNAHLCKVFGTKIVCIDALLQGTHRHSSRLS